MKYNNQFQGIWWFAPFIQMLVLLLLFHFLGNQTPYIAEVSLGRTLNPKLPDSAWMMWVEVLHMDALYECVCGWIANL